MVFSENWKVWPVSNLRCCVLCVYMCLRLNVLILTGEGFGGAGV